MNRFYPTYILCERSYPRNELVSLEWVRSRPRLEQIQALVQVRFSKEPSTDLNEVDPAFETYTLRVMQSWEVPSFVASFNCAISASAAFMRLWPGKPCADRPRNPSPTS